MKIKKSSVVVGAMSELNELCSDQVVRMSNGNEMERDKKRCRLYCLVCAIDIIITTIMM